MIGFLEILAIGTVLLVPVLIILAAFKVGQILINIQKDVNHISKELRNKDTSPTL